jgi:hypothetical protein
VTDEWLSTVEAARRLRITVPGRLPAHRRRPARRLRVRPSHPAQACRRRALPRRRRGGSAGQGVDRARGRGSARDLRVRSVRRRSQRLLHPRAGAAALGGTWLTSDRSALGHPSRRHVCHRGQPPLRHEIHATTNSSPGRASLAHGLSAATCADGSARNGAVPGAPVARPRRWHRAGSEKQSTGRCSYSRRVAVTVSTTFIPVHDQELG